MEKKKNVRTEHAAVHCLHHINQWSWHEWPMSNPDCDWWQYGNDAVDDNDDDYDNDDDDDGTCSK